jgi:hypothetical protein
LTVADDSLVSDDLLRTLVGVGHVDLLVGIPTLNHAGTISDVVKAVEASFRTYFPRQRTTLINSDAGSTDDTMALVQNCCLDQARTVTASSGLRTTHRISTPYHGTPGKTNAVRLIFSSADLLQANGVVVLDPDVANITPEWVAALAAPLRDRHVDFVAPVYRRQVAEGHLVTQLLRPLIRATYGWRVREPLASEFGCSGRFAAHCAEQESWGSHDVQNAVHLWLTGTALAGSFSVAQTELGTHQLVPSASQQPLADLFRQVVTSAFAMIDEHAGYWLGKTEVKDVPMVGAPVAAEAPDEIVPPDGARILESFDQDVKNLEEILRILLTEDTFAALTSAAADPSRPGLPDALWATTVGEFLVAYHHNVMRRDHIAQALLPLYMARAGTFLHEHANSSPEAAEAALESLCVHFEQVKTRVVDRWTQPAVR